MGSTWDTFVCYSSLITGHRNLGHRTLSTDAMNLVSETNIYTFYFCMRKLVNFRRKYRKETQPPFENRSLRFLPCCM